MRHAVVTCVFVLVAGLLLGGDLRAGSLEPPGAPGPTMKTIAEVEPRFPISSLPVTIGAQGSYYLTGNLTGVAAQSGITITASFVTLDLNGYELIGVGGSLEGIRASVAGTRHLVIRNGVIRNWASSGVSASSASDTHVEDLRVDANTGNGLTLGVRSIVRNTSSTGNGGSGIITADASTITASTAANNGGTGISMGAWSTATECTALQNATGIGLAVGSRVVHSVARLNGLGITGSDAASIEECTVDGNTDDGIRISNRGVVRGNIARGNTNDGIEATGNSNRIEGNESTSNGVGIRAGGISNLIIRNSTSNGTEYVIGGGNLFGPLSTDPATAGPWANFDL